MPDAAPVMNTRLPLNLMAAEPSLRAHTGHEGMEDIAMSDVRAEDRDQIMQLKARYFR